MLDTSTNNLIKLVRNVFLGEKEDLDNLDIKKLCNLARFHSIEYIIYTGLCNYGFDIKTSDYARISEINAYKTIGQDVEFDVITKKLSENEICFMPLKGSVIRKMYPKIEYRNMADIDILVKVEDLKKAGDILKKIGYSVDTLGGNHDSYNKEPYMHVEIHRALIGETLNHADYYDDIWRSKRIYQDDNDKYHYYLRDEDFYIFMIFHASKHFSGGGTGFRTVIDEYIYLKNKTQLDFDYINQELAKIGLLKFSNILKDSVDYIFYHQEKENINNVLDFLSYIIDSGVYGNSINSAAKGVIDNGTKKKFILRRLFPTYKEMKSRNPILKKAPILLPWFYFTRLLKGVIHIGQHKKSYNQVKNLNEEDVLRAKRVKEITGVE